MIKKETKIYIKGKYLLKETIYKIFNFIVYAKIEG
jgi:hypothetical protein